jgi:hypothetical protein
VSSAIIDVVKADTQRGSGLPSLRESLEAMQIDFEIDTHQYQHYFVLLCPRGIPNGTMAIGRYLS